MYQNVTFNDPESEQSKPKRDTVGINGLDQLFFSGAVRRTMTVGMFHHIIPAYAVLPTSLPTIISKYSFHFERAKDFLFFILEGTVSKYVPKAFNTKTSTSSHIIPAYAVLPLNNMGLNDSYFIYFKVKNLDPAFASTTSKSFLRFNSIRKSLTNVSTHIIKGKLQKNTINVGSIFAKYFSSQMKDSNASVKDSHYKGINKNLENVPTVQSSLFRGFLVPSDLFLIGEFDKATRIMNKNIKTHIVGINTSLSRQVSTVRTSLAQIASSIIFGSAFITDTLTDITSDSPYFYVTLGDRKDLVNPTSLISNQLMKPIHKDLAQIADSGFLFNQSYSTGYFSESYVGEEKIF